MRRAPAPIRFLDYFPDQTERLTAIAAKSRHSFFLPCQSILNHVDETRKQAKQRGVSSLAFVD